MHKHLLVALFSLAALSLAGCGGGGGGGPITLPPNGNGSPPALSATISADTTEGTAPLSVTFSSSVSGGTSPYSYSWAFGDGGTSSAANPQHTFSSAETYTVRLTVTDSDERTATSNSLDVIVVEASGANILVSPDSLGFGVVSQPKELDLTIENDSTSTDTITGSVRIFSGETDFSIISGEGNFELSPAQSHVVTVRFSPTGPFTFNRLGTLRITHNASNRSSPINVPLSGGG